MSRETFLLIAVAYYALTMLIVVIVLVLMNKKYKKNIYNCSQFKKRKIDRLAFAVLQYNWTWKEHVLILK